VRDAERGGRREQTARSARGGPFLTYESRLFRLALTPSRLGPSRDRCSRIDKIADLDHMLRLPFRTLRRQHKATILTIHLDRLQRLPRLQWPWLLLLGWIQPYLCRIFGSGTTEQEMIDSEEQSMLKKRSFQW
jgi:hypothetical protein